ncbi:MAG: PQQ-dependent sugar dehydrogenase [Rhodothermales bacterium]
MILIRLPLLLLLLLTSFKCVSAQEMLEPAFPNLSFRRPVDLQAPPDATDRLFVVEQPGVIRVFANDRGVSASTVFLDIEDRVNDRGNEEGLLGLAFHPDYAENGWFYVYYSADNPRRSVIARYRVDPADPNQALVDSESIVMTVNQPFGNHNGGQIVFGPDGYLYIGLGDGGSANDPMGNGQNRASLLGSILRIDVDAPSAGRAYGIPADNPYAGNDQGFDEEIYAYGLRNPWRFSFDSETGLLWAGDVGQNRYEEVDVIVKGGNYGWNVMEATHCFRPESGCDTEGLTPPVWEYGRGDGGSITGGYVYRGAELPDLFGKYIFADFSSGRIWALTLDGARATERVELLNSNLNIAAFGVDRAQNLYLCAFDGSIYRLRMPE